MILRNVVLQLCETSFLFFVRAQACENRRKEGMWIGGTECLSKWEARRGGGGPNVYIVSDWLPSFRTWRELDVTSLSFEEFGLTTRCRHLVKVKMALKHKRNQISIDVKCKILAEIDKNTVSKSEIARKFGIQKSTLFTILKNRDKTLAANEAGVSKSRVRAREGKFPLLEKALVEWLQLMRSSNTPIDGNFLKEKAKTFAEKMDIEVDFKASNGWFEKFKDRHGLSFKKLCGESADVDLGCVNGWRQGQLKRLVEKYQPNDIFNADETGLYYKLFPDKSLVFKGEGNGHGGKRSKQRLTALLAANMTGTEKLPLLIIGKSANPRCFKGVKTLPTAYKNNQKAWMTGVLFEEWVRKLDRKMAANKRKILMIIDNCTAHPVIANLKAIQLEFLPPNVTAVLQPLDQGVIHCFKSNYRKMLVRRMIAAMENEKLYEIDVLGAMHLAKSAWSDVSKETIANCFRHAGFKTKEEFQKELKVASAEVPEVRPPSASLSPDAPPQTNDNEEMTRLLNVKFPDGHLSFDEFVVVDEDLQCCEEFSNEDELIARITEKEEVGDVDSDDDESEEIVQAPERPNAKEAYNAINVLRRYFEGENNAEDFLLKITEMESVIAKNSQTNMKQSSIIDFFLKSQ